MIESIDRALAVLQLFLKEERPLSVTRISKVMELHKSTVSRTLETLEHRGFIQRMKKRASTGWDCRLTPWECCFAKG